jgi:DNA-directed RNA polymerase specialized sigma24 family protein
MSATCAAHAPPPLVDIQSAFVRVLPRIRAHARYALRRTTPDVRDDLVAEVLALSWKHFADLSRRGRQPEQFVTTLALRCSQAVRGGRRVAGSDGMCDVLSPIAGCRGRFAVSSLADHTPEKGGVVSEALTADPRARVPDQAALRVDFPRWRSRFGVRDRAVLDALAGGDRPGEVATRFGISPARISQLREGFRENWRAFHNGAAAKSV